ncbi:MAG: DUF6686 family protein [Bacteroidota bacterium]
MCNQLEVLRKNEKGYLMRCKGCKRFQLGFGTTALALDHQHLMGLWKEIEGQLREWKDRIPHGQKSFYFDTDSSQVKLVLCYAEMSWLYELISQAMLILEVKELVDTTSADEC